MTIYTENLLNAKGTCKVSSTVVRLSSLPFSLTCDYFLNLVWENVTKIRSQGDCMNFGSANLVENAW